MLATRAVFQPLRFGLPGHCWNRLFILFTEDTTQELMGPEVASAAEALLHHFTATDKLESLNVAPQTGATARYRRVT